MPELETADTWSVAGPSGSILCPPTTEVAARKAYEQLVKVWSGNANLVKQIELRKNGVKVEPGE